jgi:hypothetical protein
MITNLINYDKKNQKPAPDKSEEEVMQILWDMKVQ